MCTYLIQVAEGHNERAIFRCEHGTFHLAWDRGLFYLSPDELPYLLSLFSQEKISNNTHVKYEHIEFMNRTASDGQIYFELWIEESGMKLSFEDCESLKDLLQDALKWQKNQPSLTSQEHIRIAKALMDIDKKISTHTQPYWN